MPGPEIWTQDLLNMSFSTSALVGGEWLASRITLRDGAPGTQWIRWLSPRACMDAVELGNRTLVPRHYRDKLERIVGASFVAQHRR
jgi:hypothetical protein